MGLCGFSLSQRLGTLRLLLRGGRGETHAEMAFHPMPLLDPPLMGLPCKSGLRRFDPCQEIEIALRHKGSGKRYYFT